MKIKFFSLLAFLFISVHEIKAQQDIDLFIDDMLTIAANFSQPAADAAGYQASSGWFSSAGTLEQWEFRLSVHGNALFVPSDQKTFSLSNTDLKLLEIEGASNASFPTAFGGGTNTFFEGDLTFMNPVTGNPEVRNVRFKGIDGVGRDYIPHAFVQAAIGLPNRSEVTLRAMPSVNIDGVTASTFGIGLKHNLSQYLNPYNDPESFQLAIALAYSKLNVEYAYDPIDIEGYLLMNQINVDANLWMLEAIGSKRWDIFEIFAAVGGTSSNFGYEMGGGGEFLGLVNSELNKLEDSIIQFKGDLGFNLHFDRFRLSAMGTVGEFFNANIGLHVRI